MKRICKLCGKEFEPKVHNSYTCSDKHYINCRICNKPVPMDGVENKKRRQSYFNKGFVYCSHLCSCKGSGIDKYNSANANVDLEKLKYLKTQTSMFDTDIAKELGVSVDFVKDRCKRNSWYKSEELKKELKENKNKIISSSIKEKYKDEEAKQNMLKKASTTYKKETGYDHNFKNPLEIEKYKQVKREKYGNAYYTNKDKMIYTRKQNNNGVFWTDKQLEKCKDTKLEKYGDKFFNNKQKTMITKLEKYGDSKYNNKVKIKETWNNKSKQEKEKIKLKIENSKLKKYGNKYFNNTEKSKLTYLQNHNRTNYDYLHLTDESVDIIMNREKFRNYLLQTPFENRTTKFCMKQLGISQSAFNSMYHRYNCEDINMNIFNSQFETEVKEFVSQYSSNVKFNDRSILSNMELDIYLPEKQVAIECNGTYWHSNKYKDKNYHYNKSKLCEDRGIRLIHIWEHEWKDDRQKPILENIIKNALGVNAKKIYARKCNIVIRPSNEMKQFYNDNNIQGFRGGKFSICLEYNNEVVMAYNMGSAFFGKGKYEWEVIRGATKLGYTVVGGASKIWKYFIETYNPKSCVYYIDYNYFNGNSLKNLPNMTYIKTQPSFKNFWVKSGEVKNREPHRNAEIQKLYKSGDVIPIYNAGTKVYVWERNT